MKLGNLDIKSLYLGELPVTSMFLGNLPIPVEGGGEKEGDFKLIGLDDNLDEATGSDITCWGITEYTGSDTEIVMPSYHKGLPIKKIVDFEYSGLFEYPLYDSITSITLPENLEYLGDYALAYCNKVSSIDLPQSLTNIGAKNFYNWSSLQEISLPSGIDYIATDLFYSSGLTYIDIPEGVTSISYTAFSWCTNLEEIGLPSTLENIYDGAFVNIKSGGKVFYRGTIKDWLNIWEQASTINEETNPLRRSKDLYMLDPNGSTLFNGEWYSKVTTLNIPQTVTTIPNYSFNGCKSITTVNIPSGVTYVGGFSYCSALTEIRIPSTVTDLQYGCFRNCTSLRLVDIEEGLTSIVGSCFDSCGTSLQKVVIPLSVKTINMYAFAYDSQIKVYYKGTSSQWSSISQWNKNANYDKYIINNTRYYYSETNLGSGYWHYVNGEPTVWA